jgi:DNA repair ATPase RecN
LGRIERSEGKFALARDTLKKVLAMEQALQEEKFLIPFSLVEIAEIYMENSEIKDLEKAETSLNYAKRIPTPYDFDRPLSFKMGKIASKLKKLKK